MGKASTGNGIEGSFDLLYEINETITSGEWVGDCFIFLNNSGRLHYSVGGNIQTLVHLETSPSGCTKHTMLGYLTKEDRVYVIDKSLNISSYSVTLSVLQYQTAVMRGDFNSANELLPSIPRAEYTSVARFLESQGFKKEALSVSLDFDHKFDLALELGCADIAHNLLQDTPIEDKESVETIKKWKRLSDIALRANNFELCETASIASNEYSSLLLMYSSVGNLDGMETLAKSAEADGKINIAFVAYLLTGNIESCLSILKSTNRLPEAAFFARTYLPSCVNDIVSQWKSELKKSSRSVADALVSPMDNISLFPNFSEALRTEKKLLTERDMIKENGIPASDYQNLRCNH